MQASSRFDYLRNIAPKYGNLLLVRDFELFVANVNNSQLEDLRQVYQLIDEKGDDVAISRWLDECNEKRASVSKKEHEFSFQVGMMFVLFSYLNRAGIQPFSSGRVERVEKEKKPNWNNLPKELAYLIDAAEAYGIYASESEVSDFLEHAHPNDMEALARIAEQIRLNGHGTLINDWIRAHSLEKYQEAWMVYWLEAVLAYAGFSY